MPAPDGTGALATCERAVRGLRAIPGVVLRTRSRWFSSAPLPPSGQPRFINGVALLEGEIDPADLLAALHRMEAVAGRVRGTPNAARTLDLDIIDSGGLIRTAPDPILPHPRAQLRAFVLLPLRDIAPDWRHPASGAGLDALLAALPPQDIHPA